MKTDPACPQQVCIKLVMLMVLSGTALGGLLSADELDGNEL